MSRAGFKLTERDIGILLDLYKMKYLSVSQIRRLHFPSEQTAYRRLRALKGAGYVQSFSQPNMEESIFHLARAGAQVVAEQLGTDFQDLRWKESSSSPKDYYFLRHFLAINGFRIALLQACEDSPVSLLGFIPEYHGEKTAKGGVRKYIRDMVCDIRNKDEMIGHTPDAVFALEKGGQAALFFLEIDRGTETVSDPDKGVLKCVRFYLNYLVQGKYQRYAQDFRCDQFKGFRTLLVTTSGKRLENFRTAAGDLAFPAKAKQFLWVATFQDIENQSPLGPVWRSLDSEDGRVYRIE